MEKRYIFFKGLIHTLDLYTDEFVEIYREYGAECLVLDAAHMEDEMLRLKAFLLEPVTAVISLNNVGLYLEFEDGQNIWDKFKIPFYNIMMDHPFHYKEALEAAPEQMALLCMDRNHVAYARRFFPNIRKVDFFPHAGIRQVGSKMGIGQVPVAGRQIDVLYAGGLSRYAAEGLIPDLGSVGEFDAFALVRDVLERLIQEPDFTTEYVIEQCLKEMNLGFTDKKLGELIAQLRFLDSFAVSYYREQVIRMLAESGVTVTIFGEGWDRCEWESPNVVYGGMVPAAQVLELMGQSKIVLNTMTWFKRGAHDRVFNGMLAGAAVVSDTSEYMQECFEDGKQLQLFSLKELGHMAENVKCLLGNPGRMQRMADCGYQAAMDAHLWINRLEDAHLIM